MRLICFAAVVALLAARPALACDGGVFAVLYKPDGAVFVAEVNGVPVAESLDPDATFTGTSRLTPWITTGVNEVVVTTATPSENGIVQVLLNCPRAAPGNGGGAVGVARLDAAGTQTFTFDAPAATTLELPYSDAVHEGNEGLAAKVAALQDAFRSRDVPTIVSDHETMLEVAAVMGRPMKKEAMSAIFAKVLPTADIQYLDDYEIHEALGGRLRIVTGPDRSTAPVMVNGKGFRMKSARVWSFIDGEWRLVAQ